MKPQTPPPTMGSFKAAFDQTVANLAANKHTYEHALSLGISPRDLVSYVCRDRVENYSDLTLSDPERIDLERLLVKSPWAMGRVVALVKALRTASAGSLLFRARTIPILNHYARSEEWNDEDLEGCKLLDQLPD